MSESGGFLKFSHALTPDNEMLSISFFTQVLCWEYYSKPKNSVVIQFIKYPNFEFINWKKKNTKNIRIWRFFTIWLLWTNKCYPTRTFLDKPYAGNTMANFYQILKRKINLNKHMPAKWKFLPCLIFLVPLKSTSSNIKNKT